MNKSNIKTNSNANKMMNFIKSTEQKRGGKGYKKPKFKYNVFKPITEDMTKQ